jgi:putative flippase GtrA
LRFLLRYLLVGGLNTLVSYIVFFVIWSLWGANLTHLVCLVLSYLITTWPAYLAQKKFVFDTQVSIRESLLKYQAVTITSFFVNAASLEFMVTIFEWEVTLAQATSLLFTAAVVFGIHRFWTFRPGLR